MLQETHSTALVEQKWRNQWRGKMFFSHGTSNSTGVLICITEDLDCKVNNELHDKNGRILIIDTEIQKKIGFSFSEVGRLWKTFRRHMSNIPSEE